MGEHLTRSLTLAAGQEAQQITQEGQELIREVWGVVADYYLDARGSGFELDSWTALRDRYLSQPLPTHDAAYRCAHCPHAETTVSCSVRYLLASRLNLSALLRTGMLQADKVVVLGHKAFASCISTKATPSDARTYNSMHLRLKHSAAILTECT